MYIKYKNISIRILIAIIVVAGFVSCRDYKELAKIPQADARKWYGMQPLMTPLR